MTQLWLVSKRVYVISDGPVGAMYLAAESDPEIQLDEEVRLLKRNVEPEFRPREISQELAEELLSHA
jgi:hypothetical protein